MNPNISQAPLQKVTVYEVRLIESPRPLYLAETSVLETGAAARTMHAMLGLTDREHFAALFLSGTHRITGAHVIAIGSQHRIADIDARTTFRAAIAACASAIVLGHNHPSGNADPSADDIATTANLMRAGRILGIPVVDHVIVTRDSRCWYSMHAHGTLPGPSTEV
jgi:DNA repair protein RadC